MVHDGNDRPANAMYSDREDMLYEHTLRMVLWDEDKERIYTKLNANGMRGRAADALYKKARRERIAMIRSENAKRALKGALLILLGIGLATGFWFGIGGLSKSIITLSALAFAFGSWKFINGLVEIMAAPSKKGSLADED